MSKAGRARHDDSWGSVPTPPPLFARDENGVVWSRDGRILSMGAYDALGLPLGYSGLPPFDTRNQNVVAID